MKAAIHNLGCKTNAYEAEAMEQALKEAGYEIVDFNSDSVADVCVINTCSVTNIADRKSRQMIHKAKAANPDAVIVAAGCFVQENAEEIIKKEPVDICLGSNDKHLLVESINSFLQNRENICVVSDISKEADFEKLDINLTPRHTRAFIKVQDGCNRFCSYCIIPMVRGRVRSRELEDIVSEVTGLAKNGVREVVLTGINLSSYGTDFKDGTDIGDVILSLNDIDGIERIRISSFEPQLIDKDFLNRIKRADKLCPHFHLSMQSGSDGVLARMNRGYDTDEYFEKCGLLREFYDNPSITTDVITGFPGETQKEFEETLSFVKKVRFFDLHVFQFSPRKGTKAAQMPDQVESRTKKLRSAVLISAAQEMNKEYLQALKGSVAEVLMEERVSRGEEAFFVGHTKDYVKVLVKDTGEDITGKVVSVRLTGADGKEMTGETI